MNVLLLGGGGREHAMAWQIARSSKLSKLWIAPGNAGTAGLGENVPDVAVTDLDAVMEQLRSADVSFLIRQR